MTERDRPVKKKPTRYAMERAAEEIGPGVVSTFNQVQLAGRLDRAFAPVIERLTADLREIDADERFHYPCANVVINAPLALVQLVMETRAAYAQRLLEVLGYDGPEMQISKGPRAAPASSVSQRDRIVNRFHLYDESMVPPRLVGQFETLAKAQLVADEEFAWPHPVRIDEIHGFIDGTTRRLHGGPIPVWGLGGRSEGTES